MNKSFTHQDPLDQQNRRIVTCLKRALQLRLENPSKHTFLCNTLYDVAEREKTRGKKFGLTTADHIVLNIICLRLEGHGTVIDWLRTNHPEFVSQISYLMGSSTRYEFYHQYRNEWLRRLIAEFS